ncbi:hypothetical protein L6164_001054 [Bauhinia variegata]|uniref:Uncharacterized protein n=1 Tax=Bauhinia variegata TaxID=167791 RepID=A0ACB9Q8C2_BAUVA|nr:hypothetical protein L6164_001054 [Bauhinia variegata]
MAIFNSSFLLMMVFLVAYSGLLVSSEYPPKSAAKLIQHEKGCRSRLTPKCRDQLTGFIILGKGAVTKECCDELVNRLGKRCHFAFLKQLSLNPEFQGMDSKIWEWGEETWEKCALQQKGHHPHLN